MERMCIYLKLKLETVETNVLSDQEDAYEVGIDIMIKIDGRANENTQQNNKEHNYIAHSPIKDVSGEDALNNMQATTRSR